MRSQDMKQIKREREIERSTSEKEKKRFPKLPLKGVLKTIIYSI